MAFAASVRSKAFVVSGFEATTRDLWAHALAAGAFAKEIAKVRKRNAESMFLCGLLHDIGLPVILHSLAQAAGPIRVSTEDALTFAEENHTSVGGKIARAWKLPEVVALAAEHHHGTDAPEQHAELGAATALADALAHATFDEDETAVHDPRLASILNLYPDEIAALLARRDAIRTLVETQP
jgi:putative nucleotidyltransferase with HDIG domain